MNHPYIGILINHSQYIRMINKRPLYHERISFYEMDGKRYELVPCYFRLRDIKPGKQHVYALIKRKTGYMKKRIAIPGVVHNRTLYTDKASIRLMEHFVKKNHVYVFNRHNRYGKKAYLQ
ncbi:MAG: hypothetical protein A2189_06360 [Paenibacillus sp. RIFOXYA1_FULL_44_5]|nr:MAG: hypothetical protein A2189_06360 [Paenibacillus sp. RIFOXYA1_FULL_44_5]